MSMNEDSTGEKPQARQSMQQAAQHITKLQLRIIAILLVPLTLTLLKRSEIL